VEVTTVVPDGFLDLFLPGTQILHELFDGLAPHVAIVDRSHIEAMRSGHGPAEPPPRVDLDGLGILEGLIGTTERANGENRTPEVRNDSSASLRRTTCTRGR
jgi:hypothetical protein